MNRNIFNNEKVNNININLYADDTYITVLALNDTLLPATLRAERNSEKFKKNLKTYLFTL